MFGNNFGHTEDKFIKTGFNNWKKQVFIINILIPITQLLRDIYYNYFIF